jgi:enterochelin esterase-like enzyme
VAPGPQTGVNPSGDTGQPIVEPTPGPEGTYADAPEAKLPPDAPKGQMLNFSYRASTTYPGTQRDVSVYVPSQYKGDRPACLYVKLDGSTWASWNEPAVFENLIAKDEMPVTIMVALTHGTVWKDKEKDEGLRYDRTYEWTAPTIILPVSSKANFYRRSKSRLHPMANPFGSRAIPTIVRLRVSVQEASALLPRRGGVPIYIAG